MGLQYRPIELQRSGSIGSISYRGSVVNIDGLEFSAVVTEETSQKQAQKNTATESGGVQYSIKNVNGKQIVWIENSGLSAKQLKSHTAVAEYIAQHIGEVYTIIESGQKVYIGEDLPGEYTQSKYTRHIQSHQRQTLKAKNKAISSFGLLIETATNRRWEQTYHTHNKDAKYGMYRYSSSFAFPTTSTDGAITAVHAYDAELLIRNASDGKKYLYDIVDIERNTSDALDLQQRETRKGNHSVAAHGSASDIIIRTSSEKSQQEKTSFEHAYEKAQLATSGKQYDLKDGAGEQAQKNTATESGGVQYSLKQLDDGRWYVQADRQVLFGSDPKQWGKQIESFINSEIRKGEDVSFPTQDGHVLVLTERSAYKLSDRHKSQIKKENREFLSDAEYALKGTVAGHIDELIQVGKFDGYKPDESGKHKNDIGEDGFNYFKAYFKDGGLNGGYYLVRFSAGLNENQETVYSIGDITKRRFPSRRGSSGNAGAQSGTKKSSDTIIRTSSEKSQQEKTSFEIAYEKAQAAKSEGQYDLKDGAGEQAQKNITAKSGVKYDLKGTSFTEDRYFARKMDKWDELSDGSRVKVGVIQENSALHQVGLPASGMYFDVGKIKKAMDTHGDHLTAAELKSIPELLENPIVIAEYTGKDRSIKNTVNVYGNLFFRGKPIVVGIVMRLDRSGNNVITNVRTIHAQSDVAKRITNSSVLYLDENKKRTQQWFQVCGNLNVPLEGTKYGLIRSISFENESVNENESTKPGNQYSLKGVTALEDAAKQAEINRLLERELEEVRAELKKQTAAAERAKGELKRSTPSVRKAAVDKLVRKLLREYSSYADAEEISARLKALGDELVQSETVDWDRVWEQVYRIAETVVDDAQEIMDTSDLELFREIRRKLKDTKILMSEADRGDIPDYNLFRVQNMSRLRLNSKEGMPLDEFWEALHGEYGELFPAELTGASDRLNYLVEKLDRDWKPMTYNPHDEYGREGVIVTLAQTMIAQVMEESIRTPKTFADKQYEQQEQLRRMLKEQREKMRARYEERVEELTAHYRGQLSEASESRKAAELRAKITRHVEQMSRRLLKPTKTMNVPAQLHGAVADVLAAINMESGFDWAIGADGKRHRVKRGTTAVQQKNTTAKRDGTTGKIDIGMSDEDRYHLLKGRSFSVVHYDNAKLAEMKQSDYDALQDIGRGRAFSILKKIGEQFGVFKGYQNSDAEIEFAFSKRNLQESVNKQETGYDYYAQMLSVFDDVIENAIGIEVHANRYERKGENVGKTYVFVSGFATETGIVPVLLEVREFLDGTKSSLYVAVSLQEIERSRIVVYNNTAVSDNAPYTLPASAISIAELFANVNLEDKRLLKYIPDEFLNMEQKNAKKEALLEQETYVATKNHNGGRTVAVDNEPSAQNDTTQDETILPTKRTEAFLKLMAEYRKIKDENTDGVTIDPDLMGLKEG